MPIGRGAWIIDIDDDQYTAAASGMTAGLLRVFATARARAPRAACRHGNLVPSTYASSITSDKKTEEMRITLAGGNVKDYAIEPPSPPHPDRIPVTEAHRRGVIDPMSGSLARVAGTGDMLSPEACNHKVSLFDGRMRYDLKLAFKRMDTVKADKGYQGPAVVCALYFVPIAGYVPDRRRSSIWSPSATWRSGSCRSPERGSWCRSGSRSRRRSGWACSRPPVRHRRAAAARRRANVKVQ